MSKPIGSREYSYFKGERNVRNGVIVECNWHSKDQIVHCIADFGHHVSAYTLRSCFKTREKPDTRSQFYKDERPYEVFENVNFEADEANIVAQKVARNQKKWECFNMGRDIFAVKDVCLFSRDNPPRCYSELAGKQVEYNLAIAKEVLQAHVPFDCYLQFTFVSSQHIQLDNPQVHHMVYRVHSIQQVNPEKFGLAFKTPWLKLTQPAYQEHDPFFTASNPEKEKNLPGIKAYALTGKKVYVPSRPRWRISLVHNKIASLLKVNDKDVSIKPHMPLLIDVRYNTELNRYIVYDATLRADPPLPHAELVDGLFHKSSLARVQNCPGFFRYRDMGLVFDKYGLMVQFYFEGQPSNVTADFTYFDPDERAYSQLGIRRCYDPSDLDWKTLVYEGIYIGNCEFYSPYLHFLILRGEDEVDYKVGKWYELTVTHVFEEEGIADVKAVPTAHPDVPHKKVGMNKDINEFLVDISSVRVANNHVVFSEHLGAIGLTENELARCEGNIRAAAIQFPAPEKNRDERPQLRPRVTRLYKTLDQGKSTGSYQ